MNKDRKHLKYEKSWESIVLKGNTLLNRGSISSCITFLKQNIKSKHEKNQNIVSPMQGDRSKEIIIAHQLLNLKSSFSVWARRIPDSMVLRLDRPSPCWILRYHDRYPCRCNKQKRRSINLSSSVNITRYAFVFFSNISVNPYIVYLDNLISQILLFLITMDWENWYDGKDDDLTSLPGRPARSLVDLWE